MASVANDLRTLGVGKGLYSVPDAARLSRVPARRVRRWAEGYAYTSPAGEEHVSPPVWHREYGSPAESDLTLSFRDLLEIRAINLFREHGLSWARIRAAAQRIASEWEVSHPFSDRRFSTDGRTVWMSTDNPEKVLLNVLSDEHAWSAFLRPSLVGVEYLKLDPVLWFPMAHKRVVIDPQRCFGQPITNKESVPTSILRASVMAEGSIERTARVFEVPPRAVRDAIAFEESILKAA